MTRTVVFAREQLRAPFTLALLVAVPALFVVSAAGVLSDFASALGGSLAGDAAVGGSAGGLAPWCSLDALHMTQRFHKMHGLGNDFVILDGRQSAVARRHCRRQRCQFAFTSLSVEARMIEGRKAV